MTNPARQLSSRTLDGGWKVRDMVEFSDQHTGSTFSICYQVEGKDGTKAFLKALDYSRAMRTPDPAIALKPLVDAFLFERELLERCKKKNLDRIVKILSHGSVKINESIGGVVQYIIFEFADRDIKAHMDFLGKFDLAWTLRAMHHISTGLQQLHGLGTAHQDVKPSNVLVFDGKTSKIGDVGRASIKGHPTPLQHEQNPIAGDPSYAPPELQYGYLDPEWGRRRLGCDLYLLGSMLFFLFTRQSVTSLWFSEIREEHHPKNWGGTYEEILPVVRDAFGRAVEIFRKAVPKELQDDLVEIARQLCDPDPMLRGDPWSRQGHRNHYSIERYISRFNSLAFKAEILMTGG